MEEKVHKIISELFEKIPEEVNMEEVMSK